VDYSEADILDRKWWLRWRILLNEMMTQEDRAIMEQLYSYHLALVSNSGLTEDSFKSTQASARENFEEIVGANRPWIGRTKEERFTTETDQMKIDWKKFFGWDLDDPVALESWREDMKQLMEDAEENTERVNTEAIEREQRIVDAQERVRERRAKAYRNR